MIIDELVIQNVGTFSGRNKIVLTPKSTAKPIVLVGGLNGAGKTTFLEAINLALYGAFAQPTGRRGGGYEAYLKNLVHRGKRPNETSSVELTFRAHQQGKERRYRVARSWGGASVSGREHLEVDVDDLPDKALTSTWSEHVETFLPRGIAALFFFDGEQIEALADMEQSRDVFNTALSALMNLDLVDRLGTDLGVLRRRHRTTQVPDALKARVEERKQAAVAARQSEECAVEAAGVARVEYERLEKVHRAQAEHYRSAGGEMLDQRTATEQEMERNKKLLDDIENELHEQASDAAPFLVVSGLLADLERQVRLETTATTQRVVARELAERDQALLDLIVSMKTTKKVVGAVTDFLTSDRERRIGASEVSEITGLPNWIGVHTLRASSLPVVERTVRTLVEQRETIRSEIDQLERVLVSMPDPESIEDLRTRLDDASTALTRQQATLALIEQNLQDVPDRADQGGVDLRGGAGSTGTDESGSR